MNVRKRNGSVVEFDGTKIETAMRKAFVATGTAVPEESIMNRMLVNVYSRLFKEKTTDGAIDIEAIQDAVEQVLAESGYFKVCKAYVLYRFQRQNVRDVQASLIDYSKLVHGYLDRLDWRVKENSTVQYTLGGFILSNSGAVTANYWLNEIYDAETARLHKDAAIHLHDLSMLSAYCAGWNLKQLICEGIKGVSGRIASAPAKHLSTLCNQMVNFLGIMQNEWAGAQAFSSFDTYLAPYVKRENLDYKSVRQCVQSFVYGVNTPSRWGCQSPFTNVTIDWKVPEDMKDQKAIVAGEEQPFTYGECQAEMDMINKAFIEIMTEGDAQGRGFQYPIPTYSITKDFDWSETENNKLLFEMTAKYGTPYFSNYVNSDMKPSDIRSMCPLHGNETVLVRDDYSNDFHLSLVKNLFNGNKETKEYEVIFDGKVKKAKLHRYDDQEFYRVRTVNGHEVVLSGSHANLVLGNEVKRTDELTTEDYLPFNVVPLEGVGLSYEDGLMVGAFMGDGSLSDDRSITLSLNEGSKKELMDELVEIAERKFGAKVVVNRLKDNCVNVRLNSRMLRGLVEEYVHGKALEKEIDAKCVGKSLDFRRGILDGYMRTDGGTKNRICSASKKAVLSLTAMLASMGIPTKISVDERDSSETLSDNPVYSVRPYSVETGQTSYGDVYVKKDDRMWFRIESVERTSQDSKIGYCFEVLDDETPYFMLPSGIVTHNCRLRLDLRELKRRNGGFFGAGESTGSVGVVTINLPQLAYLSENEEDFWKRLDHLMDVCAKSLHTKREVVSKLLEVGLYPYTKAYLGSFDNHFSTIGICGGNEMCLNAKWLGKDLTHKESQDFVEKLLNHMRDRLSDYQEKYEPELFNLEATPAESTAFRFAKHDKERFPDILTAHDGGTPYYTNSTNLPVGSTDDVFDALDVQDRFQPLYTSGTVFHTFLGEKLPNWKSAANLVRTICANYKLPYVSISPTYSVCPDHGYVEGEHFECPKCGKETEVYSRITGYYRPVKNWNDGKTQEFKDRLEYDCGPSKMSKRIFPKKTDAEKTPETEAPKEVEAEATGKARNVLVTTSTCPKCVLVKKKFEELGFPYEVVVAGEPEADELISKFQIATVPTLLAFHEDGSVDSYVDMPNAIRFAEGK